MHTALDTSSDAFDSAERSFVASIREHGWFGSAVMPDTAGPSFSFTTGFWVNAQKPELIVFGMRNEIAHQIFWDLFRDAQAGKDLPVGVRTGEVFSNFAAYVFPVARRHYPLYFGWSRWFYAGDDFPCLQIVWPDRGRLFPWEAGFDPALAGNQIDLTEYGWLASLAH
jgi:hypothetical protein